MENTREAGISLAVVIAMLVVAGPAAAKPTPAAKCLSAKLKAAAKQEVVKVGCHAKAAKKQTPLDAACLAKAGAAFAKAVGKAESKPGCASVGDAAALEPLVDEFVDAVVGALPDGGTKSGGKCAASKRNASAKYASAELLCHAVAVSKAIDVDLECIEKAETAFEKAFAKAELKGGCATVGDVAALDETADDFVDAVVAQLTQASTSTTTTITSTTATTNTLPGTTTTTTMGPTLHTVTVGPQGSLSFSPAMLTIKAGDTVRWVWASSFHNVVSGQVVGGVEMADGNFCVPNDTACGSAPLLNTGATYDHTFPVAGTFPYFCVPHGSLGMVGTIVVQP